MTAPGVYVGVDGQWRGTSTRPEVQYGALPVGQARYPIPPSGVRYVAPTGADANPGTLAAPYRTLKAAAASAPDNATIVMRAGIYHEGGTYAGAGTTGSDGNLGNGVRVTAANVTVQNYPGEEVWLDGSEVVNGWVASGSNWIANFAWTLDRARTQVRGEVTSGDAGGTNWGSFIQDAFPIAHWPEAVFIDGVPQQQVQTLAEVGPGKFFVNGAYPNASGTQRNLFRSTSYVIGSNPNGREVRIAKLSRALSTASTAAGLTFRGIGVRRYANTMPDWGCFYIGSTGAAFENVDMSDISDYGIHVAATLPKMQRCTIARCGRKGVGGTYADGYLIEYCRFTETNCRRFGHEPDGGAFKVGWVWDSVIRHNIFEGNKGHCIWYDASCYRNKIYDNWFSDNLGHAVFYEISSKAWIVGNVVIDAGVHATDNDSLYQPFRNPAFRVVDSNRVHVWHNTIINPEQAIGLGESNRTVSQGADPRQPSSFFVTDMTWEVDEITVRNNAFIGCAGINLVQSCFYSFFDQKKIKSTGDFGLNMAGNLYTRPDGTHPQRFANGWNSTGSTGAIDVYWNLTSAASGTDTAPWTTKAGEAGSQLAQTNPIVDRRSGTLATSTLSTVTPASVPAEIQALVDQCIHPVQRVGAGIFTEV